MTENAGAQKFQFFFEIHPKLGILAFNSVFLEENISTKEKYPTD